MSKIIYPLILLLILACSDKSTTPSSTGLEGEWTGELTAIYPGPDDATLTVIEQVSFEFEASDFLFYWHGTIDGPMPFPKITSDELPYGVGQYRVRHDTLTFYDVEFIGARYQLLIDGDFIFNLEGSLLFFSQTIGEEWATIRDFELERSE